jgi:nanoRNase/pAp phosphatase (c-di-AMP/oligoRNAs hydrolase)
MKEVIRSIREKNRIIENIISVIVERESFLMLGHKNPDEDCIASMVAFAILLSKFMKQVRICLPVKVPQSFQYLINICRYNSIQVLRSCEQTDARIDTVVVCDTAKKSMIEMNDMIGSLFRDPDVVKVEIDHHLGADSEYIGDPGCRLVTEATSASELVGHIILKLSEKNALLRQYQIENPFSRNIVLAILTGIVGDTNMGKFIKSRREQRYYRVFSNMFNRMLADKTTKDSNFKSIHEIYMALQKLSSEEDECHRYFQRKKKFSSSVGYVALDPEDMDVLYRTCDEETVVSVARAMANELAEESGRISLVAYYENPMGRGESAAGSGGTAAGSGGTAAGSGGTAAGSGGTAAGSGVPVADGGSVEEETAADGGQEGLIQFRARRSQAYKRFDLRKLLDIFSIKNGGGHEGAIGFRVPSAAIDDYQAYVQSLVSGIEKSLP